MQLSGSFWQSVLQPKRSHDNHPIGGVRARPLSRDWMSAAKSPSNSNELYQCPNTMVIVYSDVRWCLMINFSSSSSCNSVFALSFAECSRQLKVDDTLLTITFFTSDMHWKYRIQSTLPSEHKALNVWRRIAVETKSDRLSANAVTVSCSLMLRHVYIRPIMRPV